MHERGHSLMQKIASAQHTIYQTVNLGLASVKMTRKLASQFLSFHLDLMHELAGPPSTRVRLEGISLIKVSLLNVPEVLT